MGSGTSSTVLIGTSNGCSRLSSEVQEFKIELQRSEFARKIFSDFIMNMESTEEVLKELMKLDIDFTASFDASLKAGFVNSEIIVVFMVQFLNSPSYREYCEARLLWNTPIVTRQSSQELCL